MGSVISIVLYTTDEGSCITTKTFGYYKNNYWLVKQTKHNGYIHVCVLYLSWNVLSLSRYCWMQWGRQADRHAQKAIRDEGMQGVKQEDRQALIDIEDMHMYTYRRSRKW